MNNSTHSVREARCAGCAAKAWCCIGFLQSVQTNTSRKNYKNTSPQYSLYGCSMKGKTLLPIISTLQCVVPAPSWKIIAERNIITEVRDMADFVMERARLHLTLKLWETGWCSSKCLQTAACSCCA